MSVPRAIVHMRGRETDRFTKQAGGLSIVNRPLNARNDAGSGARTVSIEHLDGDEVAPLGNTIRCPSNDSGNVGSVAVLVRVRRASDKVGAPPGASIKVLFFCQSGWSMARNEGIGIYHVGDEDPSVNYIPVSALAGSCVVAVSDDRWWGGEHGSARDAGKAP